MTRRAGLVVALPLVALVACTDGGGPELRCPDAPPAADALLDPARLLVAGEATRVVVEGRAGAAAPFATIALGDATTEADAEGAFTLASDDDGELEVTLGAARRALPVVGRDVDDVAACAVGPARATGTLPNDVALVRCGDARRVAVPLSAEGALDVFDESGARRHDPIAFPLDDGGAGAEPFALAVVDAGPRAVVTLWGQHAVALVDLCAGRVLDVARPTDDDGAPWRAPVSPPLELPIAVDADLDGVPERTVVVTAARHPQSVAVAGADVFVAFTNHLSPADATSDQILAPGVLARFRLDEDALAFVDAVSLGPALNPQAVVATPAGLLVSLSGPFARGSLTATAADGALVLVDPASLTVTHTVTMGRFAPARPALAAGFVVVGSLLGPRVARVPLTAPALTDAHVLEVPAVTGESFFDAAPLGDDLVVMPGFASARLHVVDVARGVVGVTLLPDGLPLTPSSELLRGALALDVEDGPPGRARAAVLLGLSSEVLLVDLAAVFGP